MQHPGPESDVRTLCDALEAGEVTATGLVEATLDRIGRVDDRIHAWLRTARDEALAQADDIDRRRRAGDGVGPLAGIPVGIKDAICTRGVETTAGSRILSGFVPPYDATVVARLRGADAIPIGKLNMDEFAMGSSNENSAYGPVHNPWDLDRVPGGSSGGSAAAVAAGMCPVSLGTDTGGSIRQPASFCGVVGIKPTYGRVSRWGVVAFASSLDQVGPLGRTVGDAARLLEAIWGHDPLDSTSIPSEVPVLQGAMTGDIRGLRIGVPAEYFIEGMASDVEDSVRGAIAELEGLGCELVPISLPHTPYALAAYYVIATAEASSNLSRYDGVRYGHRSAQGDADLHTMIRQTRAEGFGAEVKRRIILGTYALSSGYYDAYYRKAQRVRTLVRRDFDEAFGTCDLICAPVSPITACRLGERLDDPLQMYLMDVFTIPASLAGLPCLSVPCGFDGEGLPVGLHMMAPALEERRLVRAAHAYEQATTWHAQRPPLAKEADR